MEKLKLNKTKYQMVGIRLTDEIYKIISDMAKKEEVPKTEICRALIELALNKLKDIKP